MPSTMTLTTEARKAALAHPGEGIIEFVLDTDTKNEIDDQFAVVYALLAETLSCQAIYAAPFKKPEYPSAAIGMEASYQEILTVLDRMGDQAPDVPTLRGSTTFISDTEKPDDNEAVRDLIQRCKSSTKPVYVVAIGALTNIASAIMLEPKIRDNMVVLWLGGNPDYWPTTREFNLSGDLRAAQIVFDSGVPLIQFPCINVAQHITSVPAEMDRYVRPCGAIGEYLATIFAEYIPGEVTSKVIWDLAPLAWLVNPNWLPTKTMPTPKLTDNETWDLSDATRPVYRIATQAFRDPILGHFVELLQKAFGPKQ